MSEAPIAAGKPAQPVATRARHLQSLPRRTYRLRILGMGLASLPLMTVAIELGASWATWAWIGFTCLLWPHLAYLAATRSRDPFHAELRNFVIDSMFAGSWLPMMHFNLLPSALLLTTVMADKISAGVRGLWRRSLPGMLGAIALGGLITAFAFHPVTSMAVVLACLPIMVIHSLAVSLSSHRLVRRVQVQNLQLEELTRIDALTDLDSRGHWLDQAERLLKRHHDVGQPATLMLLDIDWFKDINDRHGHTVGDDVLRGVAVLLRRTLRSDCYAGRLGGDEFVVALPASLAETELAAERLRAAVEDLEFSGCPGLRCSVSIGLAEPPAVGRSMREWIEAADRALYLAKHAGRNRTRTA